MFSDAFLIGGDGGALLQDLWRQRKRVRAAQQQQQTQRNHQHQQQRQNEQHQHQQQQRKNNKITTTTTTVTAKTSPNHLTGAPDNLHQRRFIFSPIASARSNRDTHIHTQTPLSFHTHLVLLRSVDARQMFSSASRRPGHAVPLAFKLAIVKI